MDVQSILSAIDTNTAMTSQSAGISNSPGTGSQQQSVEDIKQFEVLLTKHDQKYSSTGSTALESVLSPLNKLDLEASSFKDYAAHIVAENAELTPSEIIMLTAKSQEFLFYSQMTANVANRSADGLQQLYRQQG